MKDQPDQLRDSVGSATGLRRLVRAATPLAPTVTLVVLAVLALRQWTDGVEHAVDAAPPPLRLAERLPLTAGAWVGQSWDPPDATRALLREVRRRGRVYENVDTGRRVAALIVEADDRRDLVAYAPARWYATRGWRVLEEREVAWRIAGIEVPALEHALSGPGRDGPDQAPLGEAGGQLIVTSFTVDAWGELARRLELPGPTSGAAGSSVAKPAVDAAGANPATTRRGGPAVGLVQVVFAGDTPRPARAATIDGLMRGVILSIHQDSGAAETAGDQP